MAAQDDREVTVWFGSLDLSAKESITWSDYS
jgi:hypothetical protein